MVVFPKSKVFSNPTSLPSINRKLKSIIVKRAILDSRVYATEIIICLGRMTEI
jgi:hypothetical protein